MALNTFRKSTLTGFRASCLAVDWMVKNSRQRCRYEGLLPTERCIPWPAYRRWVSRSCLRPTIRAPRRCALALELKPYRGVGPWAGVNFGSTGEIWRGETDAGEWAYGVPASRLRNVRQSREYGVTEQQDLVNTMPLAATLPQLRDAEMVTEQKTQRRVCNWSIFFLR